MNPLHLDERFARASQFGRTVAHGALGLAIATGLMARMGITRGTLVALVAVDWSFLAPLFPGEAVQLRLRVRSRRRCRGGEAGLVRFNAELVGRKGTVLQRGVLAELVRRAPVPSPAGRR